MNQQELYLKVALGAAKKAGVVFKKNFGKPKHVSKKNGNYRNLVTEIDKNIESLIKREISKSFPEHRILGEESGWSGKTLADYTWILDPIDGTTNYIQGLPLCCISIALWDKRGPLIGVVYNPLSDMLFSALRGKGAYLNGQKIKVSSTTDVKNAIGSFGWTDPEDGIKLYPKLVVASRKLRVLASSVLATCFVGNGIFDYYVVPKILIWDFAAGAAIILEAGGKITDFQGRPFTISSKSAVISNKKIHTEILNKLKDLK
jgi:myo-inositol-1(or 4)-monophosphatase